MASDGCQPLSMGGKLVGYNRDNQSGISFPASATSYRDLRLGAGGGGGGGGGGSCMPNEIEAPLVAAVAARHRDFLG